jgi:hypothetical protein
MRVVANQAVVFDKSMLMACPHPGDVLRPGLILVKLNRFKIESQICCMRASANTQASFALPPR